jgi:hypothetical protein
MQHDTASAANPMANRTRGARTLALTGLNLALYDGFTNTIYGLLPIWQTEFAESYGILAIFRGRYFGTMACLQIPAISKPMLPESRQ